MQELHQSMLALHSSLPRPTAEQYAEIIQQYEHRRLLPTIHFEDDLKREQKKFSPDYRELLRQQDALALLAVEWAQQLLAQAEQVKVTKSIIPSLVPGRREKLKKDLKKLSKLVDR